ANTAQQNAATAADTLMSGAPPAGTPVSQTNLGDRAGRVNEFWVNGQGRNPEQPFINDPAAPRGFRSNTDAPQSGDLYQPSLAKEVARNMVVPISGGIETAGAHWAKGNAQAGLDAATAAFNKNPSDANLDALQTAKEKVAFYEGLERMGQAGFTAGLVGMGNSMLSGSSPV